MGGHRKIGRSKLRWSDVIRKETGVKTEEYDRIENFMRRPQIGKRPKKKSYAGNFIFPFLE